MSGIVWRRSATGSAVAGAPTIWKLWWCAAIVIISAVALIAPSTTHMNDPCLAGKNHCLGPNFSEALLGLEKNHSLTELDISGNKIGDQVKRPRSHVH